MIFEHLQRMVQQNQMLYGVDGMEEGEEIADYGEEYGQEEAYEGEEGYGEEEQAENQNQYQY